MAEHHTLGRARCPGGVNLIMVLMMLLGMVMRRLVRILIMRRMKMRRILMIAEEDDHT